MSASIDHVGLSVPDLDDAARFFVDSLGAREVFRLPPVTEPGAAGRLGVVGRTSFELLMLDLGGTHLELLRWRPEAELAGPPPAHARGAAHVALRVDDLPATLRRLRAVDGVSVVGEPVRFTEGPTPGLLNAFVTTPWGALLELLEWPS